MSDTIESGGYQPSPWGGTRAPCGLARCEEETQEAIQMRIKLLSSAMEDLYEGRLFYERQGG